VFAALTALAAAANITLASDDPIAKLDEQIEALATDTGRMPNRLVIGLPLWNKLRNNAKVIARFPGAASIGVSMAQFSSLLLNPSIDIRVGILARDTNKLGLTKANVNIIGQQVVICHVNASPTLFASSFMKAFRLRRGEGGRGPHLPRYRRLVYRLMLYFYLNDLAGIAEGVAGSWCSRLRVNGGHEKGRRSFSGGLGAILSE
jgi:hypothetical protein